MVPLKRNDNRYNSICSVILTDSFKYGIQMFHAANRQFSILIRNKEHKIVMDIKEFIQRIFQTFT